MKSSSDYLSCYHGNLAYIPTGTLNHSSQQIHHRNYEITKLPVAVMTVWSLRGCGGPPRRSSHGPHWGWRRHRACDGGGALRCTRGGGAGRRYVRRACCSGERSGLGGPGTPPDLGRRRGSCGCSASWLSARVSIGLRASTRDSGGRRRDGGQRIGRRGDGGH